jgi:hypothetical protein
MAENAEWLSIPIGYTWSIRSVYTTTTRILIRMGLAVLLIVASSMRPVGMSSQHLPSWVRDFTTPQSLIDHNILQYSPGFTAAPYNSPRLRFSEKNDELILTGVYVATVTSTLPAKVPGTMATEVDKDMKLITYTCTPRQVNKSFKELSSAQRVASSSGGCTATFLNTSWGPFWTVSGDIVIIARGSKVPLVLRRCEDYHFFVGGCLLIIGELRDFTDPKDPGFSSIMRGSVWDEVGKSYYEEEFFIR